MGKWILSFVLMAIEAWGSVYFYDIFMERKRKGWLDKCRHIVLYFGIVAEVFIVEYLGSMGIKVLLALLTHIAFCSVFYKTGWKQCIFFSVLDYTLLFLVDYFLLQLENILMGKGEAYAFQSAFLVLPAKMFWICLLFLLHRIWKGKNCYGELSRRQWRKFCTIPMFTVAAMLSIYFA